MFKSILISSTFLFSLVSPLLSEGPGAEDSLRTLLNDQDIRETWQPKTLELCVNPPPPDLRSNCWRLRNGYRHVNVEVLNARPPVLRIADFVDSAYLGRIEAFYNQSTDVESQNVEGYSRGHRGRRADGLWLEHDEPLMRSLFRRLQSTLRVNPAIAEEFLILKYEEMGHYAMHFDYLEPMPVHYDDGWYAYYGNRFATALLLVRTAESGGFTVFPRLHLAIQPQPGDLLLWLNADSNNQREEDALHAACPIQRGLKMAVSLWIRANFQDSLKCAPDHAGYDWRSMFRAATDPAIPERLRKRPKIPSWVVKA